MKEALIYSDEIYNIKNFESIVELGRQYYAEVYIPLLTCFIVLYKGVWRIKIE